MNPSAKATLVPNSPAVAPIASFEAEVGVTERRCLQFRYQLHGAMDACRIPVSGVRRRADRLWEHTCFEVFIRPDAEWSYYEFNFSPSGEWAVYAFQNYRQGGALTDDGLDPAIVVERHADRLELRATVPLDRLPIRKDAALLYIGLAAVIESDDGSLSYWAHKHPGAKPDFHHPDSFALELAFPGE
jgi:hypothetical protein